ncbi:hypothetical protein [Ectothiorhodospira lacustris]|uniref:hypothetical protein n=1 Tax=Ectothiorhodospira lacustris TaxID=2899127 RepID=UPI001EE93645|nr:hypothetical protein [Ectothiorhodospira lacustris]MCG5510262.1 hypothetical protein [Ectothiorhodospira lacustris]MCG5521871.1 hypothetical protein [Ectothiorhodospira lacustris]
METTPAAETVMEVYVTKWALTKGIVKVGAQHTSGDQKTVCFRLFFDDLGKIFTLPEYAHAGEWFHTLEEARAQVEKMRAKEIAVHRQAIDDLKARDIPVISANKGMRGRGGMAKIREELLSD